MKNEVVSWIISQVESEMEESDLQCIPFSSDDSATYDPSKTRLLESPAEAEEQTNHNASSQALEVLSII